MPSPVQQREGQPVLSGIPGPDGHAWPLDYGLLAEAAFLYSRVRRWSPPLAPEDLIPVVGIELSSRFLVPLLPYDLQLSSAESCIRDCAGAIIAAEVAPHLGLRFGYLPSLWTPNVLSEDALLGVARTALTAWDYAEAAAAIGVTRARLSQVASLLLLSPEIQQQILTGKQSVSERDLRAVAAQPEWEEQLRLAGQSTGVSRELEPTGGARM